MHPEIEKLIEMALADGQISDKEREIILRKAEKLGLDGDEVEMYLEGRLGSSDIKIESSNQNHELNKVIDSDKFIDDNNYDLLGFINQFNKRLEHLDSTISDDFLKYTDTELINCKVEKHHDDLVFQSILLKNLKIELSQKGGFFSSPSFLYSYRDEIYSLLNLSNNVFYRMYFMQSNASTEYLLITKLGYWSCNGRNTSKTIIFSKNKLANINTTPLVSGYVNQLFYKFFRDKFNFTDLLKDAKVNLDFDKLIKYLNRWSHTDNNSYSTEIIKLNSQIKLLINDYNDEIDSLIKNREVEFYGFYIGDKFYKAACSDYFWRRPSQKLNKNNFYYTIEVFLGLLQRLKYIINLVSYRNEMILCVEDGYISKYIDLKNVLEEQGVYLTKFEKEQLKSLESINAQMQLLNNTLRNGFESISYSLNTLNSTIESSQKGIINEMKTSAIINSIQAYQLYKINKNLKYDSLK